MITTRHGIEVIARYISDRKLTIMYNSNVITYIGKEYFLELEQINKSMTDENTLPEFTMVERNRALLTTDIRPDFQHFSLKPRPEIPMPTSEVRE